MSIQVASQCPKPKLWWNLRVSRSRLRWLERSMEILWQCPFDLQDRPHEVW